VSGSIKPDGDGMFTFSPEDCYGTGWIYITPFPADTREGGEMHLQFLRGMGSVWQQFFRVATKKTK